LPDEQPQYASEQQFADAMFDHEAQAFGQYVRGPLQLTGVVRKVALSPDGAVNEVFFEPQVEDLKTHQKTPFAINCRIPRPVPQANAAVGKRVTVGGRLTGGGKLSATLNECVAVSSSGPAPKPPASDKPADQPQVLKADELGKTLYEGQQAGARDYVGR